MGSSYAFRYCWTYSTYAGDSCDSDVPFCGMCNTQLRIGLSFFLHCAPFAYTLLVGRILLVAWLWDSFLRFPQCVLLFFRPMYPLHWGRLILVEASIPLGERWLSLCNVLSTSLSYGCSLVDDL